MITGSLDGLSFDNTYTRAIKFGKIVTLEIMVTTSNAVNAWTTVAVLGEDIRPINPVIAVAHLRNDTSSLLVSIATDGKIDLRETGLARNNVLEMSVTFIASD